MWVKETTSARGATRAGPPRLSTTPRTSVWVCPGRADLSSAPSATLTLEYFVEKAFKGGEVGDEVGDDIGGEILVQVSADGTNFDHGAHLRQLVRRGRFGRDQRGDPTSGT